MVEAIRSTGEAVENGQSAWRVTVRLDDGSLRTLPQRAQPPYTVGDRVRIGDSFGLERA